jgi:voltage-gated potassium channel
MSVSALSIRLGTLRRRLGIFWPLVSGLFFLTLVFCLSITGLMHIEGWDFFDSLYMTITTVGYGEVHPLSQTGRGLMMLVIVTGVGSFFYLAGAMVQLVVEGHIQNLFGRRWMRRTIGNLKDHVIICGYGRIGSIVAREIMREHQELVVIERNPALVEELAQNNILHVAGDATKDETLAAAGLQSAKSIVISLNEASANLYVTLSARQLNPNLHIVARCDSLENTEKLKRAGANQVMYPHLTGGMRMAQSVLRPTVVDFMNLAMRGDCQDLHMEELTIGPESEVIGKNLVESQLRQRFNIIVIGIKKTDGRMLFNPQSQEVLSAGETLILVGSRGSLSELQKIMA